jgi:hypothetical protein
MWVAASRMLDTKRAVVEVGAVLFIAFVVDAMAVNNAFAVSASWTGFWGRKI